MPGGALHLMDDRRARRRRARSSRCTATPASTSGQVGLRLGPAHQRRRPARGAPRGHRRPHLAPAPDRRPDLRAGQGHHRAARRCCRRRFDPRSGRERGVGHRARRRRRQRDPATAAWSPAPSGSSTRSPGPTASRWSASWSHEIVAPYGVTAQVDYQRGVPPVVNEAGLAPDPGRGGEPGARRRRPRRAHAEPRRRGLRLVPRPGARARWPGSAPARPAGRRTTCTRATCASTSGPPGSAPGCWPTAAAVTLVRAEPRPATRVR